MAVNSSLPPWWNTDLPDVVARRAPMPAVERWQTQYVRYKTQPEAHVQNGGWDLAASRRFAEALAAEEGGFADDTLLYDGLAPRRVAMRVVEAPAEFAVPVKQDRRLTPNFRVRVEVLFRDRCSFPLTVKAYVVGQQDKDSVPEWVPEDFLDPEAAPVRARARTHVCVCLCVCVCVCVCVLISLAGVGGDGRWLSWRPAAGARMAHTAAPPRSAAHTCARRPPPRSCASPSPS
ncbi:MAG: hypothetical protein J3K34DRAFT_117375 [Monoraphidium minutum]|nr:MAG: hypothetical protein J3K34DRAFT_117375 [Monoraphidium minutum]